MTTHYIILGYWRITSWCHSWQCYVFFKTIQTFKVVKSQLKQPCDKQNLTSVWYIFVSVHHHHHHHIHFRALFSSTEGWAFWQVFLEGVLSTQNDPEGQQNPYLASFCYSQALHPMISLACQIFSVQPHSACVLLQSSLCCALHVQTISSYWCGAPHLSPGCQALWEGSMS